MEQEEPLMIDIRKLFITSLSMSGEKDDGGQWRFVDQRLWTHAIPYDDLEKFYKETKAANKKK
jgi:hypothetical protein